MAARKVRGSASNASVVNMTNSSRHGGSDQSSARSATSGLNGEANAQHRSRARARRNWRRAKYAVTRKITQDMLGVQRRYTFWCLCRRGSASQRLSCTSSSETLICASSRKHVILLESQTYAGLCCIRFRLCMRQYHTASNRAAVHVSLNELSQARCG